MSNKTSELTVNGVKLSQIDDEATLNKLINQIEDFDTRKAIRARLQQVKLGSRAQRDQRLEDISSIREEQIQQRKRDAEESKARTLKMYDNMAKSGNAGDHKPLDINTYRGKASNGPMLSGTPIQKTDLVEETIRARARACDENKRRVLAAYDFAAKTQPAGTVRDVDFEAYKKVDLSGYEQEKPSGAATFAMSGGVPKVSKASLSTPSTPIGTMNSPNFSTAAPELDAYERSLRQRKQEADERKRRTLAAYDIIARSGCGPKVIVQEELQQMEDLDQQDTSKSEEDTDTSATPVKVKRSPIQGRPTNPKDALLHWCYMKTRNYENVQIENFSSSWSDGLAFCALLHNFFPDAIEYDKLSSETKRENFDLAFKVAEEKAKVYPLLETEDMLMMGNKPDWKCIYTYVQALFKGLKPFDPTQKK